MTIAAQDSARTGPQARAARSWLFTAGDKTAEFGGAARAGADAVIYDLEDAVAPANKHDARAAVLAHLGTPGDGILRAVRINPLSTVAGLRDMDALLAAPALPAVLVIPKVESAGVLDVLRALLDTAGASTHLVPLVESARGVRDLAQILVNIKGVAALMIGAGDLAADLGAAPSWDALAGARAAVVVAAAAAGVPVIDAPYFDVRNSAGLQTEVTRARDLGCTAKAAIHPGQVAAINAAFTPTHQQVEWAHAVLKTASSGVGTVDGQMVDAAIARRARRILEHVS